MWELQLILFKPVEPESRILYCQINSHGHAIVTVYVHLIRFSESIFDEDGDHTYEMEYEQPRDGGCHAQVMLKAAFSPDHLHRVQQKGIFPLA